MSVIPKKTYSRHNSNIKVNKKENVDLFDELLSSPLKQEVRFQPLSFWDKKMTHVKSTKKSKKVDCGLFETSDSDERNSPCRRERKPKVKFTQSKARSLQCKGANLKLSVRRDYSTANSFIKKSQVHKHNVVTSKSRTYNSKEKFKMCKGCFLSNNLNSYKIIREKLNSSHQDYDSCKFTCPKEYNHKSNFFHDHEYICSVESVRKSKKSQNEFLHDNKTFIIPNSLKSEVSDGRVLKEQLLGFYKESVINNSTENFGNSTICSHESMEKTETPFLLGRDSFKFVTVRRHFNSLNHDYMCNGDLSCSTTSVGYEKNNGGLSQSWSEANKIIAPTDLNFENDDMLMKFLSNSADDNSIKSALIRDENLDDTMYIKNNADVDEKLKMECEGESAVLCDLNLMGLNDAEVVIVQEFLRQQKADLEHGVSDESSQTSDKTFSSFNNDDTVVNATLKSATNESVITGSASEKDNTYVNSSTVSFLTDGVSELSITKATAGKNRYLIDLKNVTTKRRGFLNDKTTEKNCGRMFRTTSNGIVKDSLEIEPELDQSLWLNDRSLDWNKLSLPNPVFESTRVTDITNRMNQSENSILEETLSGLDCTCALKPGKKWMRSMSVLKQIRKGSITGGSLESTRITGRKFESFVQDLLEIQNEKSNFFTALGDVTISNKTLKAAQINDFNYSECKNTSNYMSEKFNVHHCTLAKSFSSESLLEISSLSHTVKVIQPEVGPSDFRSALGLEPEDIVKDESSVISARDFILMQCGQEDILPFEEYFNERTLKNCKKIGEGVFGEVFMSSDTVIKIIPIEGLDRVNGEPQKTFEEIISEVVIASKLSNLRKGEKHRTDGFSEMKRCWCVKGKYPKYILDLWEEYDQLGSGSENDSPIMFKDDQLYIILELANGGKDLESFVFNSSAQSLSAFIQTAFSLAAAEKTFEFEHRDLHWGNVLISETKDKFMSIFLDGVEFKIPTKGVKVCIIDFTLSRINHEGCCIFNDLSVDPSLFASEGDYQFEIYRMMFKEVKNDWSLFRPKTNIFWLHYMINKIIRMVRYKNKKSKLHAKHLKDLKSLESEILKYKDSTDLALSSSLNDVINKL